MQKGNVFGLKRTNFMFCQFDFFFRSSKIKKNWFFFCKSTITDWLSRWSCVCFLQIFLSFIFCIFFFQMISLFRYWCISKEFVVGISSNRMKNPPKLFFAFNAIYRIWKSSKRVVLLALMCVVVFFFKFFLFSKSIFFSSALCFGIN